MIDTKNNDIFSITIGRYLNGLTNFIRIIANYKKLTAVYLDDEISTPYFGLSLVFDLRLASNSMKFCLSHASLGFPPIGGLAYLLPRFIGIGKATEYLMMGGNISADEAYELGLVNAVLSDGTFYEECDKWLLERLQNNKLNIIATRKLMYFDLEEYTKFIAKERNLNSNAIQRTLLD